MVDTGEKVAVLSRNISITHYVNPQLFWFRFNNETDIKNKLTVIERQLSDVVSETPYIEDEIYKVNDYVAVHDVTLQRYIRGVIKDLQHTRYFNQKEYYIIWAIDHGYPLRATHEQLRWLPMEFCSQIHYILRGGLANIWPMGQLKTESGQTSYIRAETWCQSACQQVAELLLKSENQVYVKLCFAENIENIEHYWCEVNVILPNDRVVSPLLLLTKQNLCQVYTLDLFRLKRNRLTTHKEKAWQSLTRVETVTSAGSGGEEVKNQFDENKQKEKFLRKQFIEAYGERVERQVLAKHGTTNLAIVATNTAKVGIEQDKSELKQLTLLELNHCGGTRILNDKDIRLVGNMQQFSTTRTQNDMPSVHKNFKKSEDTKALALSMTQCKLTMVHLPQKSWIAMRIPQLTPILVSLSSDYTSIYAQVATEECLKKYVGFSELLKKRVNSLKPLLLSELFTGEIYIVSYMGKLYRALLQSIVTKDTILTYRFLYVDIGQFCEVSVSDVKSNFLSVYQSTREIIENTQFQAIHCTLAGITVKQSSASCHQLSLWEFITNLFHGVQIDCYAVPRFQSVQGVTSNFSMHSYGIVLFACVRSTSLTPLQGVMVNKALVESQLASFDYKTRFYLRDYFGILEKN